MKFGTISKVLKKIKKYLKFLNFLKIPIPNLRIIQTVVSILGELMIQIKEYLINFAKKESAKKIETVEETQVKIEEEIKKPLPQQNNDVLREQARRRHNGK